MRRFIDRHDAGRQLAQRLEEYAGRSDVLVVALPRGGVPVAFEIARLLGAPLEVLVVRKLGVPGNEEYAMGAIASGGVELLEEDVVRELAIPASAVSRVVSFERRELERRERIYRRGRPFPDVRKRTVLVVDDGLATGTTMAAAVRALRRMGASRVVACAPVGSPETAARLRLVADDCVCVFTHFPMRSVGEWYVDFSQTTDDEVLALMDGAMADVSPRPPQPFPEMRW